MLGGRLAKRDSSICAFCLYRASLQRPRAPQTRLLSIEASCARSSAHGSRQTLPLYGRNRLDGSRSFSTSIRLRNTDDGTNRPTGPPPFSFPFKAASPTPKGPPSLGFQINRKPVDDLLESHEAQARRKILEQKAKEQESSTRGFVDPRVKARYVWDSERQQSIEKFLQAESPNRYGDASALKPPPTSLPIASRPGIAPRSNPTHSVHPTNPFTQHSPGGSEPAGRTPFTRRAEFNKPSTDPYQDRSQGLLRYRSHPGQPMSKPLGEGMVPGPNTNIKPSSDYLAGSHDFARGGNRTFQGISKIPARETLSEPNTNTKPLSGYQDRSQGFVRFSPPLEQTLKSPSDRMAPEPSTNNRPPNGFLHDRSQVFVQHSRPPFQQKLQSPTDRMVPEPSTDNKPPSDFQQDRPRGFGQISRPSVEQKLHSPVNRMVLEPSINPKPSSDHHQDRPQGSVQQSSTPFGQKFQSPIDRMVPEPSTDNKSSGDFQQDRPQAFGQHSRPPFEAKFQSPINRMVSEHSTNNKPSSNFQQERPQGLGQHIWAPFEQKFQPPGNRMVPGASANNKPSSDFQQDRPGGFGQQSSTPFEQTLKSPGDRAIREPYARKAPVDSFAAFEAAFESSRKKMLVENSQRQSDWGLSDFDSKPQRRPTDDSATLNAAAELGPKRTEAEKPQQHAEWGLLARKTPARPDQRDSSWNNSWNDRPVGSGHARRNEWDRRLPDPSETRPSFQPQETRRDGERPSSTAWPRAETDAFDRRGNDTPLSQSWNRDKPSESWELGVQERPGNGFGRSEGSRRNQFTDRRSKGDKSRDRRESRFEEEDEDEGERERRARVKQKEREKRLRKERREAERTTPIRIILPELIAVKALADALKIAPEHFVAQLGELGFEGVTLDSLMAGETAALVAQEYGYEPTVESPDRDIKPRPPPEDPSVLPLRPPVVTIMGHVDHGKTTILDYLRKSSIAAQEHGGITQHIGAFSVTLSSGKPMTFLDTPGHAAFLTMRQRGANVTDIVVLVVAADDSVMPQTLEALNHARAAKVPVIVAINKVDVDGARIDAVKHDLAQAGLEIEDFGGDVQVVCVSGKTGQGMEDLEENILTLSEILDHRAETDGPAEGWVLESSVKFTGKVATVLIKRGTLRLGDVVVAGLTWARVRQMRNEAGQELEEAPPGTPVEIFGWKDLPAAGDQVLQAPDEARARSAAEYRESLHELEKDAAEHEIIAEARRALQQKRALEKEAEAAEGAPTPAGMTESSTGLHEIPQDNDGIKRVNFIVKADVHGSVEAVCAALQEIGNHEVRARILRSGAGSITEFDVELASLSKSIIVNFATTTPNHIKAMAEEHGVRIIDHTIIYRLIDDVKALMSEYLSPEISTRVLAEAEVLQIFPINTRGRMHKNVAGCRVRNGLITKTAKYRIMRSGEKVFDGNLETLKNVKKDVLEMRKGTECGMGFENYQDMQVGDLVQAYEEVVTKRSL